MRERRVKRTMALVLGGAAVVWACDPGEVMVDAGRMLVDAGEAVDSGADASSGDGGESSDAAPVDAALDSGAPPMRRLTATCEPRTRRVITPSIRTDVTYWYAQIEDSAIRASGGEDVRVVICGREFHGPAPGDPEECPSGATCTMDNPATIPALRCRHAFAEFEDGRAQVVCGTRVLQYDSAGTVLSDSGEHGITAHFTFDEG